MRFDKFTIKSQDLLQKAQYLAGKYNNQLLINRGYDPIYGARPLKRAIQQVIENPLALEILKGHILEGSHMQSAAEGDAIVFTAV